MARYPRLKDGEGVAMKSKEVFRFACCDCGLVHDMILVAGRGQVGMALKRNARSTAAMRRAKKKPTVREG